MQKFYMWIGSFTIILMIYLFVAPKLVKKPAAEPPRSGSNKEMMMMQQMAAGVPAANGSGTYIGPGGHVMPQSLPASPGFGAGGNALQIFPEGYRGSTIPGQSFGGKPWTGGGSAFTVGGAFRARRRMGRAFRGIKSRSPNLNLFPFANVSVA